MSHRLDPAILRDYDIRGIVGTNVFPADAEAIGRAFCGAARQGGRAAGAVGYGGTLTSPELEAALVKGPRPVAPMSCVSVLADADALLRRDARSRRRDRYARRKILGHNATHSCVGSDSPQISSAGKLKSLISVLSGQKH